jgi:hypothetical protein
VTSETRHDPLRRLFSFLAHLGWQVAPRAQARTLKTPGGEFGWYALSLPDGATLLAVSTSEELPSTATAFRRFEDFAPVHRRVRAILRGNDLQGRYVLLLSGFRAHLIDQVDDDLLLAIETREEWDNRLLPLLDLQSVARGSLSGFPRKSLHQRARELADWTHLWSARIGSRIDTSPAVMARFFDWLHVSRTALRRLPALRAGGEASLTTRRDLEEIFRHLAETYNLLQGTTLKAQLAIAEEAHRSGLLAECLESYALLSSAKLDAATMAEAFADDALRLMSWRSSVVAGPTLDNQDDDDPFGAALSGYEVNLDTEGTTVLLRRFDDLVHHVTQGALNYELSLQRGQPFGVQLDLLAAPIVQPRVEDAIRHVLRHILRVTTADPRRADLARLILAARTVEATAESGHPLRPLPALGVELRGTPVETSRTPAAQAGLN